MKNPSLFLIALCCGAVSHSLLAQETGEWDTDSLNTAAHVNYLTDSEKKVILLINEVRTNPKKFADQYLQSRQSESSEAKECFDELQHTKPLLPLLPSRALSFSSRDHAKDMGEKGKIGHVSSNGKTATDRVKRYGTFTGIYTGPWGKS